MFSSQGEGYHLNHNEGPQQGHSPHMLEWGNHTDSLRTGPAGQAQSRWTRSQVKIKHAANFWSFYNQFCSTVTQIFFVLTLMPVVKIITHMICTEATERTTNICNLIQDLNKPLIFFQWQIIAMKSFIIFIKRKLLIFLTGFINFFLSELSLSERD